jgi:GLPGLI family protein
MLKAIKTSIIAILCLTGLVANAQKKITQGTITYALEYNLPADKEAMAAMLPQVYKMSFKGDLSKFTMDMGMFSTLIIYNNVTKETLSLTEVPIQSKKIAVKMNKEQTQKMAEIQGGNKDFEFTTTTEKKQIAGYNCTKYLCKDKQSGSQTAVWATQDIEIPLNTLTSTFKGVNGVPIQFSTDANGMKAKITIKSIVEESVEDINMVIPKEYEIMEFDDLLKQLGG